MIDWLSQKCAQKLFHLSISHSINEWMHHVRQNGIAWHFCCQVKVFQNVNQNWPLHCHLCYLFWGRLYRLASKSWTRPHRSFGSNYFLKIFMKLNALWLDRKIMLLPDSWSKVSMGTKAIYLKNKCSFQWAIHGPLFYLFFIFSNINTI